MRDRFLLAVALACCITLPAPAHVAGNDAPSVEIGGLAFGDVYAILSHHSAAEEGASGFVLRRGYLTANFMLRDGWRGRVRVEVNQDGEFEAYSFDTRLKDLYLAREFGRREIVVGLSPTLTYDLIEATWGARYLMRTPLDLQGVQSRDTGITLTGLLGGAGRIRYRLMYGSGLEYANQGGGGDKLMGAVTWSPSEDLDIDLYTDFEQRPGPTDRRTWQIYVGNSGERLRWGLQYSHQDRQDDPRLELASGFAVARMREKLSLVARIDRLLEPSPRGDDIAYIPFDPGARATMSLAGMEWRMTPTFRLTPNLVWTTYDRDADGVRPDDDLHLRLTFFLDLE